MPSFFNFQQGHDPHGATTDSSPLLGRFRAVPDAPRRNVRHRNSLSLLGSFTNGSAFGRGYGGVFGSGDAADGSDEEEGQGLISGWLKTSRELWLDPKQATVRRVVDKWWTRWLVLVILPAALVSFLYEDTAERAILIFPPIGRRLVCSTLPSIRSARRRRCGIT